MKHEMKFIVGKYFRTRGNNVVEITTKSNDSELIYAKTFYNIKIPKSISSSNEYNFWAVSGKISPRGESEWDVISEISEDKNPEYFL